MRRTASCCMRPDHPAHHDPEYDRGGITNLFLVTEPLRGWRAVMVSTQRTRPDFAACIKELVDVHYPYADRIMLVLDQLNIHTSAAFFAAFPPAEAKRLAAKLDIHHTPKHGSWLNMAELELNVLQRQCLGQRIPDREAMAREVTAWAERRNAVTRRFDWQFTTADARTRLRHLYPAFNERHTTRATVEYLNPLSMTQGHL